MGVQGMQKMVLVVTFISSLALASVALARQAQQAQQSLTKVQALTNKDVVDLLGMGLTPEIVTAKIKSSACSFDTSPQALKDLKAGNVPDSVILAMVQTGSNSASPLVTVAKEPVPPDTSTADGKPRIYVSDSESWMVSGGFATNNGSGGGATVGGSSPQTVEIIKTLHERCPEIMVTNVREKAAYAILFDRESFKGVARRRDKIAVFRRDGDTIFSDSTRSVGNAVKDACQSILKDFAGAAAQPK
jgi:hypothetical protein